MVFIKGLLIGIFMCAPVGPVGLLSVKRTLTQGRAAGLASVLGAATADLLYCCLAGFGITLISNFLQEKHEWLELAGGLILVCLGIRIFFSKPATQTANNGPTSLLGDFTSTFALMLTNPFPLVVFTATFTALGVPGWKGDFISTSILVAGVFAGSALWSPILVGVATFFRPQLNSRQLKLVNQIAGVIMAVLGLVLVFAILLGWQAHANH
jgi:threonine/homoserine/homoserine lactone efflux protein